MPDDFEGIWRVCDAAVARGRYPGYAAAVRIGGHTRIRTGGRLAFGDAAPVGPDSQFRIASVTKPVAAALTLSLVQDGLLRLDDPIATWIPEAAEPRVLADPLGPLEDTVPADRPVLVRDLLTFTSGWGIALQPSPLQDALFARDLFPSAVAPRLPLETLVAELTSLPLAFQPGTGWLYHLGLDLLGALLVRATGGSNEQLLAERVTGPLGMDSTGFWARDPARLATQYRQEGDELAIIDPPDGVFSTPPPLEQLAGGLVSTASDLLRFFTAVADGGGPVLSPATVAELTRNQLDAVQLAAAAEFLGPGTGWGLGTAVDLDSSRPWMAPGRWGWTGGTGTSAYVDPQRDTVSVLLTQRAMTGPDDGFDDFWQAVADAAA